MEKPEKDIKDIIIRSESLNDILSRVPPKLIRWGSALFLMLIILMLFLSWLIKYPDVITSEAYLTTATPPQKVYAKITARIDTLLVIDKQQVDKDAILAILENTSDNEDVLYLKSIMDTITINKDQVLFPFETIPILFLGDLEPQFGAFENSYFQYIINRDLKPHNEKIAANSFALTELNHRLNNLVNQQAINKKELDFIKKDLNRHEQLLEKGVVSQQTYEDKQINYYTALRSYENTNLMISQLRESLNQTKSSSKDIGFNKQREETRLLKQVLYTFRELKKGIRDWEQTYVLKSNRAGIVAFLDYWSNDQTLKESELVFTISPENVPYYLAKLRTPKTNAGKIRIGQQVKIKLNDYPDYEFGVLQGQVLRISNVSNTDGTYVVDVRISKDLKTTYDKHIDFKQDMQGTADIITEDLRLIERCFYQFRELFSR
ncbi:HlyD family secretion protein [Seonamhaeicola aphaedonensis]|uniref:HlyD family secretion protein n=1 Tax=Seonamhaeicola aphaedonensis TaxID=1461338 RepID=A0A3D9H838_9FLAO|nr:HlyD family secretion protein [Seonamhaeicola aphaedonensis]RED45663.1 HlyD family secretion protein [Seonamhaeicola aphaedonensis]